MLTVPHTILEEKVSTIRDHTLRHQTQPQIVVLDVIAGWVVSSNSVYRLQSEHYRGVNEAVMAKETKSYKRSRRPPASDCSAAFVYNCRTRAQQDQIVASGKRCDLSLQSRHLA